MIVALLSATAWVLAGLAAGAGLFWAFVHTPESTIFTLALSLLLVVLIYVVAALTASGLVFGWSRGWSVTSLRNSPSGIVPFLLPLGLTVLVWWLVGQGLTWLDARAGEIAAWFIVQFDWSDVSWPLSGVHGIAETVRWVVVPFGALVWHGQLVRRGMRPLVDPAVLTRAASPLRLLTVGAVAILTIWAPLRYGLYWMPAGLPPSWIEPAVAAAKFAGMAVIAAAGVAVIAALAARPSRT